MVISKLGRLPSGTKLFLAEGQSEVGLVEAILKRAGVQNDCMVYCFGGLGNLGTVLKGIADVPGLEQLSCLGLVLDAEHDLEARVSSVISHFAKFGADLKPNHVRESQTTSVGGCRVGIFISPGGQSPGRIEDIVIDEIRNAKIAGCIHTFADCIEKVTLRKLNNKALVQIYISALRSDLCGIGRAFDAGVLNVDDPAYDGPRTMIAGLVG